MKNLKKYLLTLLATKNIEKTVESHKLDRITRKILTFLALYQNPSTNDCYMYLNDTGYATISYEDVDLRIQNLIDLELIQNVENVEKKSNENAKEESSGPTTREKSKQPGYIKYYSTSSAGIFYLFTTDPESIDIGLIVENKEDGLFVNFLYPCLKFETIDKLRDTRTIIHIKRFLGKCCQTILKVLKTLRRIEEKGGESNDIGYVDGLADPKYDNGFYGPRGFIQGLKNILNIEWLDLDDTKIIEMEKNKLFKLHDGEKENELFLEVYPERNVAALLDNKNHKIREFYLEKTPWGKDYAITYFKAITVKDYIDNLFANDKFYFYPEIDEYESELCEELLIHMHSTYPIMNKEDRMIQRQDYIAIAKDKTFQGLAMSFKQKIDFCHDNFIRLSRAS